MADTDSGAAAKKSQGQQHLEQLLRTHNRLRGLSVEVDRLKILVGVPNARRAAPASEPPPADASREIPFFEALGRLNGNIGELLTRLEQDVEELKRSF